MTLPALRRSLLGLSLALLTSSNTLAQTGISTETVDAPAQPNTITLPGGVSLMRNVLR